MKYDYQTFKLPCSSPHPIARETAAALPKRLLEVHQGKIILREDAIYSGAQKRIKVECTVCGHKWEPFASTLIWAAIGCPKCANEAKKKSGWRAKRAEPGEIEKAKELRKQNYSYRKIAQILGRTPSTIEFWVNDKARQRNRDASARQAQRDKQSGKQAERVRAYYKTPHGKLYYDAKANERRARKFNSKGFVELEPNTALVEFDCWEYLTTKEDRNLWKFDCGFQKELELREEIKQLEKETGLTYHIDHIIPLAAGGIHHSDNLQILEGKENISKGKNWTSADAETFCRRLFNIN